MATSGPKVVLLCLAGKGYFFEWQFEHLIQALSTKADVQEIPDPAEAGALLSGSSRPIVFAMDAALVDAKNAHPKAAAVAFVRTGGTIILGGSFPGLASSRLETFFAEFSLPWKMQDYLRTEVYLNTDMQQLSHTGLAAHYSQKAVNLANVAKEDALYLPSAASRIQSMCWASEPIRNLTQTPAAFGSFEEGKVGYLGDVNWEDETTGVLLAMCGLNG